MQVDWISSSSCCDAFLYWDNPYLDQSYWIHRGSDMPVTPHGNHCHQFHHYVRTLV